jgi:hypothetical protein
MALEPVLLVAASHTAAPQLHVRVLVFCFESSISVALGNASISSYQMSTHTSKESDPATLGCPAVAADAELAVGSN